MPIERGGYGYDLYGSSDYGTEGVVHTGSATTSVSSSTSADGYVTTLSGAFSTSCSSSVTASANATFASGAAVSSTASTASVAEQFVLKETDKFSYGTGVYGYAVYDNADLQTIVSATAASSTITATRVQNASATFSVSCSTSSACERVREAQIELTANSPATADGAFTIAASASADVDCTVVVVCERKRLASAVRSVTSGVAAIGREKWEPIPYTSTTWSDIAA